MWSLTEPIDLVSGIGSIVGGIGAAIGLFYTAFQYKKDVKARYYDTLSDIAGKIEALESAPERNSDHRTFALKYLNLFERIASFANTGFINKEIARYFENNFKKAMGLLEMNGYAEYRKSFTNLVNWYTEERLDPSPPPLPYPNIHIVTVSSKGQTSPYQTDSSRIYFEPSPYHAIVGDFVTWINDDTSVHTVTSGTGVNDPNAGKVFDSPNSGILALKEFGRTFSHEFGTKGVFRYFCRVHPTEVGEVVVADDTEDNSPKPDYFKAKDMELCLKAPLVEVSLKSAISKQDTGKDDTQDSTIRIEDSTKVVPGATESNTKVPEHGTNGITGKVEDSTKVVPGATESNTKVPEGVGIKKLSPGDIIVMSGLASLLKTNLERYIEIDPYTITDPFDDKAEFIYSVIVEKGQLNRIVAIIATIKDLSSSLPWTDILGYKLISLPSSKENARSLKSEIMPKDTNNFYPFRRSGKVIGSIMFAFQICGV